MTPTPEAVEAVAKAIHESYRDDVTWRDCDGECLTTAIAAITAMEPHLRKQHRAELYAELIAEIDDIGDSVDDSCIKHPQYGWMTIISWLRDHQNKESDDAE